MSVARDARVPAIYAEYHGGGLYDSAGVEASVAGCLRVLATVGVLDDAPPAEGEPRVFEDSSPGSGNMQANHPAPCDGFFEPTVALGERVAAGDPLGSITDLLGRRVELVRASYAGIVIVLHTFARVDAGTGVAVVLLTGGLP